MWCLLFTFFLAWVTALQVQACPEPLHLHIQNYEGPIIMHTANYDNQPLCEHSNQQLCNHANQNHCNYGNPYKQNICCDSECTCVSKQNYAPYYAYGGSVATNVGSGCCPVADVKPVVYCVCDGCGSNGCSNNLCGNQGYQCYPSCQSKQSGCC